MHPELSAKAIVEALIFSHPEPLGAGRIAETIQAREDGFELSSGEVAEIVAELNRDYEETGRCFSVIEIGGGYTFATRSEYHPWLQFLQHENASRRLSQSALEVLSIVAFRQPVTKPEIDHIRGVDSGYVVRQLLEKELVDVAGRNDSPGRPLLYRTNGTCLKHFGINSIDELPRPREIEEILQDDDMAQHRQLIMELKAELQPATLNAGHDAEQQTGTGNAGTNGITGHPAVNSNAASSESATENGKSTGFGTTGSD
jgi:segregation and condensation protein B